MKWIEWIQLRTAGFSDEVSKSVIALATDIRQTPGLDAVELFSRARLIGEVSILLFWDTDPPQPEGSLVGLQLAKELNRCGWVSHAVWIRL